MIIEKPEKVILFGLYQLDDTKLRCINKKKCRRNHGPWGVDVKCIASSTNHRWQLGKVYNCYEGTIGNNYNFVFEEGSVWKCDDCTIRLDRIDDSGINDWIDVEIIDGPRIGENFFIEKTKLYNRWRLIKCN